MLNSDLALDFGSVNTRIANASGRILAEQPSVVLLDENSGKPVSFGEQALGNAAQSAGRVRLVHPVVAGQLADIAVAELLLAHVIGDASKAHLRRRRALATVPLGVTPVQLRAMSRALEHAGVHRVRFIEQPVACAIGARVAIEAPLGVMVIDIGGEITNIAAIALGGVVVGSTVRCGGETFDRSIAQAMLDRAELIIDPSVASQLRHDFASLETHGEDVPVDVVGRDSTDGRARTIRVRQGEISEIVGAEFSSIVRAVAQLITQAPPDIANDIMTSGIVLAGGASQAVGVAQRLAAETGIPVHLHDHPSRLGVLGAAKCLGSYKELEDAFIAAPPH